VPRRFIAKAKTKWAWEWNLQISEIKRGKNKNKKSGQNIGSSLTRYTSGLGYFYIFFSFCVGFFFRLGWMTVGQNYYPMHQWASSNRGFFS
jgi:hypothetical protein